MISKLEQFFCSDITPRDDAIFKAIVLILIIAVMMYFTISFIIELIDGIKKMNKMKKRGK